MSRYISKIDMFGVKAGSICECDGRELFLPTNIVKFIRGRQVVYYTVKVPIEVVECFDEYFEKIKS
jgi:hypothetical protein